MQPENPLATEDRDAARIAEPQPLKRRKRRWWWYGLLTLGALAVLVGIGIGGFLVIGRPLFFKHLVDNYTESRPQLLGKVEIPPDLPERIQAKLAAFRQAALAGPNPESLKLSANELNGWLWSMPHLKDHLKDRLRLRIYQDELHAQFSVPLEVTRQPQLRGRHLNGWAKLELKLEDGFLKLRAVSLDAGGRHLPGWLSKQLRQQNLLGFLEENADFLEFLHRIENVEVRDGFVVFTPVSGW